MRPINDPSSAEYLDAQVIFSMLEVGDLILLEADVAIDGLRVLLENKTYEILVKQEHSPGNPVFIVQSPITNKLIEVHPSLVASYYVRHTIIQ